MKRKKNIKKKKNRKNEVQFYLVFIYKKKKS